MKVEKTITDITELNGISTIYTDSLNLLRTNEIIRLQVGQIVTLDNINYSVLSVNVGLNTYTIEAVGLFSLSNDLIPVKTLNVTKWNISANFLFGSRMEINEILKNAMNDPDKQMVRFPLIWLFINNERNHSDRDNVDFRTELKFAFVHLTQKTYRANDRLTYVFKPILQPLMDLFRKTLESTYFAKVFHVEDGFIPYSDFYRYFYGSSDKNVQVLDAATDAIEASFDLNFKFQYNCN